MSDLDISELAGDISIAGNKFIVLRRQEVVNDFGESVLQTVPLPAWGAVFPTGDNALEMTEGYSTQANGLTVITKFRLRGATKDEMQDTFQPDVIRWLGNHYKVMVVNSYSQYGIGFIEAECVLTDYQEAVVTPQ